MTAPADPETLAATFADEEPMTDTTHAPRDIEAHEYGHDPHAALDGWDPNRITGDDYETPRALALYAAVDADRSDEEYALAEAQDGSGRWGIFGMSVEGHRFALELAASETITYEWIEDGSGRSGEWTGDPADAIKAAADAIDATRQDDGRYRYTAEETGSDYLVPADHMAELGAALLSGTALSDAYSLWCSVPGAEEVEPKSCECGEATGQACSGILDEDAMVVEWMPEQHRSSHETAGSRGVWPHNGSVRLRVTPECADALLLDADWAELVEEEPGDDAMSIVEIHERVEAAGIAAGDFWAHAMLCDRVPLPGVDVERLIAELSR